MKSSTHRRPGSSVRVSHAKDCTCPSSCCRPRVAGGVGGSGRGRHAEARPVLQEDGRREATLRARLHERRFALPLALTRSMMPDRQVSEFCSFHAPRPRRPLLKEAINLRRTAAVSLCGFLLFSAAPASADVAHNATDGLNRLTLIESTISVVGSTTDQVQFTFDSRPIRSSLLSRWRRELDTATARRAASWERVKFAVNCTDHVGHDISQTFYNSKGKVISTFGAGAPFELQSGMITLSFAEIACARAFPAGGAPTADQAVSSVQSLIPALPEVNSPTTIPTPTVPPIEAPIIATRYANCGELNAVYPHGVGRPGASDRTSGSAPVTTFLIDDLVYQANRSSDRDGDGIACEKR